MDTTPDQNRPSAPLWLLAELTYRCPLHCAFCYNPVDFATHGAELDTDAWRTVISDARALGAAQIGFSAASRCSATIWKNWSGMRARSASTPT